MAAAVSGETGEAGDGESVLSLEIFEDAVEEVNEVYNFQKGVIDKYG